MPRPQSDLSLRRGFRDADAAAAHLADLGEVDPDLVKQIADTPSPDTALTSLAAVARAMGADALREALCDPVLCDRLLTVLGTSEAMGGFLARHPEFVADLGEDRLGRRTHDVDAMRAELGAAASPVELRVLYYRQLLSIAARDLNGYAAFSEVSSELSDLAVATLDAALGLARAAEPDADLARLAVIAMGKTGGHELNYISDVDVIFVHEPAEGADPQKALRVATRLASAMIRVCGEHTAEGVIWEVDANLRPEGAQGPLTRTLASHVAYYERWATTWEFQALLKARFAAGDAALGQAYLDALQPMVWEASTRDGFVADTRAMRRRVLDNIPKAHRDRQLKLGSGGLRDVEFAVQLLQLVHGRGDVELRSPTTLAALDALTRRGYVGRADGKALHEAYEFLRTLEHRIQLFRLRRSHIVPDEAEDMDRLGRSMGHKARPGEALERQWQAHRRLVRRLHEKLFYQPLLEAVAALPTDDLRLSPEAAGQRLVALGFVDPRGALAHLEALTAGVSRRAAIQRSLLPAMLAWFSEAPDPDAGLLAFRSISESLGDSHWYLRKLRDEGEGAEQLAILLSSSRYVSDLMVSNPDAVALLGDEDELAPRDHDRIHTEMIRATRRHADDAVAAVRAIRRIRRRELSRIAIADVLGRLDILEVGHALSDLNRATVSAALLAATQAVEAETGEPLPTRIAVILMGRLGGRESGYSSDADVMFVHEPVEGAQERAATKAALAVAARLRQVLAAPGDDPPLEIDADLRPEGKNGPLVRTFASYAAYYAKWSETWEAQALLRAAPVVGDADLCERFEALIDPIRYPVGGLSDTQVREIRRIKARVESERLPRGANNKTHLKLGRGGLADVEWTVQLLQLRHGHEVEGLRTTETLAALTAAEEAGLVTAEDASTLTEAWRLVSRIRNGVVLMRGKPAESMVEQASERAGLAHLLGYPQDETERMVDTYLRTTRQARAVIERVFWDEV
ncbi:MAG: bifunctional [glutamine synthetase] adenylyltransferase/[glutamine synthetase]-adenylyl-L-tyrosine phosphorylase [Aeromicrobium sp.]|uniref:bifunctional [glutamine synthetase] adenylyltransferase/[glutamine synthetase]-adenylyl-L-tyrosine phosphorylase n=1 Tax=Aeromicrobium sp. TaxID=1871063 RepID=UPI0039E54046